MISKDREYRDMTLAAIEAKRDEEDQAEERKVVEGYATTFDAPYVLYEDEDLVFLEQVDVAVLAELVFARQVDEQLDNLLIQIFMRHVHFLSRTAKPLLDETLARRRGQSRRTPPPW